MKKQKLVFLLARVFLLCLCADIASAQDSTLPKQDITTTPISTSAMVSSDSTITKIIQIVGTIVNEKGVAIMGASIHVNGTNNASTSGPYGNYKVFNIPLTGEKLVLNFSAVGYATKELPLTTNDTVLNVTLLTSSKDLDEVVVVGYGTQRKSDVTGSIDVVSAKDVLKTPSLGALDGLKGNAAGVNIFTNTGQPGGNVRVMIRGIGTINASSDPLYVVDGVVMDGFQYMDPNDIERIEILKDASSTAIYGARGANGVILVTTKRGGDNEAARITYSGYVSIGRPRGRMDMMNATQFVQGLKIAEANTAQGYSDVNGALTPYTFNDPRLFDANGNPLYNTDWQKASTRTAWSNNQSISIQQGGKKSSFGAFITYTDAEGVMLNSYMKRISAKLAYDANLTKWLSTNVNVMVAHNWKNAIDENGNGQVPRRSMMEMPPIFPVKFPDGTYPSSLSTTDNFNFEAIENPVKVLLTQQNMEYQTQIFGNAGLTFHLLPGLDLRTQIGTDAHINQNKSYSPNNLINISAPNGSADISNYQSLYWQQENYLSYNKTIKKSRINAVVGLSWQEQTITTNDAPTAGFVDNFWGYNNLSAGTLPSAPNSSFQQWSMNSYFFRAGYTYDDKYMLTFTTRADGASQFGVNNKYSFFPSAGLGWVLSKENFMKRVNWIDLLKLHTSYGMTGNSSIGTYLGTYSALSTVNSNTVLLNGQRVLGSTLANMANPNLKWETTKQFDIGINWNILHNRINFDISYYYKLTDNLLLQRPVPYSTGFTSVLDNIGSISNRGVDFSIKTVNVSLDNGNGFTWSTTFNVTYNRNRIESLGANNEDIFPGPDWVGGSQTILRVGQSLGSFYGYQRLGVWQQGQEAAAVAVGQRVGQIHRSDNQQILGKGIPDFTGSFNNQFSYEHFDLSINFQFVEGVQISQQYFLSIQDRFGNANGLTSVLTDGWSPTHTNTMIPQLTNTQVTNSSTIPDSHWICDGSYIRASLVQLGYTLTHKQLAAIKIHALRIYATATNLFVITSKDFKGLDPESTSWGNAPFNASPSAGSQWAQNMMFFQYPKPITFTLGLTVTL